MADLETRALLFAIKAHDSINQRRKYDNAPYIVHPIRVAAIVRSVPHTEEMIAAAYLHDVVEDTPVTIEEIEQEFGPTVRELVAWLTDISKPEDGNRKTRRAIDRMHTMQSTPDAKTIKIADLIDNTSDIEPNDPGFWHVYRKEKILCLTEALREGDQTLWLQAARQVGL